MKKIMDKRRYFAAATSIFAMLASSGVSFAAPNEDAVSDKSHGGFEEIIVTARKKAESLMDVPVAVSTISASTLESAAANDLTAIATLSPQLVVSRADSGSMAAFSLRGIGSPPYDAGLEQSVSVSIDGLQTSRGSVLFQGFFDLAQVEVLKGPQALFFGKNASAGVISLTSANPTNKFEAMLRAGYEIEAKERLVEGYISGPLTDTLKARLALRGSKMDGWMTNYAPAAPNLFDPAHPIPASPEDQNIRDLSGRFTLVYEPTSDFNATLKVLAGKYKDNGPKGTSEPYCFAPVTQLHTLGVPDPLLTCALDRVNSHGNVNPAYGNNWADFNGGRAYTDADSIMTSLAMNYDFGELSLSSVTGYSGWSVKQLDTLDVTSLRQLIFTNGEHGHTLSQELRLSSDYDAPVNFSLGAYVESGKRSILSRGLVLPEAQDPVTGRYDTFDDRGNLKSETYSAFGQVRWDITPELELAGGVRYTREKKESVQGNVYLSPDARTYSGFYVYFPLLPMGNILSGKFADSNWSPEATLTYKPSSTSMVYVAYKTGFKSGGFSNPGNLTIEKNIDVLRLKSERAKGGEIGTKLSLLDRTVLFQATAYLYDFNDLQVSAFNAATTSFVIRNAASVRVKGVEASLSYRPIDGLTLRTDAAYNKAAYRSFPVGPCYSPDAANCVGGVANLSGKTPPRAPRWNLNFSADYQMPVGGGYMLGVSGDTQYTSKMNSQDDLNPYAMQKAVTLLGAGVRLYPETEKWEIAVIGRNLTDETYLSLSTNKAFGDSYRELQGLVQRGRQIRVQGTVRF